MANLFKKEREAEFMYEDLVVTQVDLVDRPATGDTFLSVRSADGKIEKVPVIRSSLTGIVEDSLDSNSNNIGEEIMAEQLTDLIEKLSESTEEIKRAASTFADVIKTNSKVEEEATVSEDGESVETEQASGTEETVATEDAKPEEAQAATEETPTVTEEATESAPVEGTTETVAAPESAPAEPTEMVAMRSMLEEITRTIGSLADNFKAVTERLDTVERSVTTPKSNSVDDTEELVQRSKPSVFHGVIKAN